MAQVKKPEVREAILLSAQRLFAEHGYLATTMATIARESGVVAGNLYRYYCSKFELFFAVLRPWIDLQIDGLEARLATIPEAETRFRTILGFLWIELPRAENRFLRNLAEAAASRRPEDTYSRETLEATRRRIEGFLAGCLQPGMQGDDLTNLTHMMMMAHDGIVLDTALADESARISQVIDQLARATFAVVVP